MIQEQSGPLDPLSATFWRLRVPHWNIHELRLGVAWGIEVPAGRACFYIVRTGTCQLVLNDGSQRIELKAGDLAVIPQGTPHRLCDQLDSPVVMLDDLRIEILAETAPTATSVVMAHFSLDTIAGNSLLESLPPVIRLNQQSYHNLQKLAKLLDVVTDEQTTNKAGASVISGHLLHVLFLATLRAFIIGGESGGENNPMNDASWLRAIMDPAIGPVVTVMHTELEKPWTVESLAKQARMSRTRFLESFRDVIGQPPLQYLTECRMQRACELLRETDFGVKKIAGLVGYKSGTSFSIAFKRLSKHTPIAFRRSSRENS